MGSLGLTLAVTDFKRVLVVPRGVTIGLANLFVVSPFLAFLIADVYGLAATLAVGLVLLGASPGGTTSNMFTHLARGDTALSVTMTAISSVAAVVTIPLFLGLAIEYFDAGHLDEDVTLWGIVARVFAITVIPLSIGMRIRVRAPGWTARNEPRVRRAAIVAFVLVVVGAVASEWELITDNFTSIALAALTLNVVGMTISYTAARIARLDDRQSTAIALELGIHNGTLAIAVATIISTELAVPAAVYSLFMFVTGGLFGRVMSPRNARTAPAPAPAGGA
jgi:bile acid:Na+ symporter, BASS family